ncbi:hypothetical protein O181_021661 [Austropuccinia psidii MF-1]|uniref:Retrotransposon gag domain-containing protein n=1 Tax=Austropuccinia psidii MF-1 TaxID=1389203 RepID=A0A9Q3GVZ5_9BASI|nr:hypothetical protein [Austropuccinia psidii MF-1]
MDNPYHQCDIKQDAMLMNKARSPPQYQDGDNMSYSEKKAPKQLPEASSWPKSSGTGEYTHMELIEYIDGLFIDVPHIPDYWITARLNTAFKGHASIWYTEMKEIPGRRNSPWWESQIIQKYSNGTWIWKKTICKERTNIGKYTPYKSSGFKEKPPFRVEFKDKPRERVAEVAKKKHSCHNCGSTEHYDNNFPKAKKKVYTIEKVSEEESPTEDSDSESMGDATREQSDKEQDPREEFLVEYQEEAPLEIKGIQSEEDMPQETANKNLCKHTQDAQTFLVTQAKGMAYIHGTATKMTVCIDNAQNTLIIDSEEQCSIVARNYLENHFPNWENQLLPAKAKNFKSASGKMTSIGTIVKEIIIPHRKGNIRLNPEFVVLDDAHIQGFLLGTDYQWMYGIDIYNNPLEELLNEFREGQFSTILTSKQKLSLLKILRKNIPAFAIGEEPLGNIRGHDIELYLDVERPYPPMLRRPPYPESLETRKEIEKHINELLDMDVIRKIGHNEIVEITTPVLITCHYGKSRLCGDSKDMNNYTKADRYPIPRIPNTLEKLAKAKYISKMDCMKGFHPNGAKSNYMKLLRIICHMGIYE